MKVARDRLLAVLDAASPALGTTRNLVPALSHFWFDGKTVTAFNDLLGIRVAFTSDFEGGVVGERLLGVLKNSTADNVVLGARTKGRNPVLSVTIGSAGVILPLRPVTESVFREEYPDKLKFFQISDKFIESLKLVMLSCVSKKVASSAERGVTIVQKDGATDLFSTDELTVSCARVSDCLLFEKSGRAIWPRDFCDYFIKHFLDGTWVAIIGDSVWCTGSVPYKSEPLDVTICAKLIDDSAPVDFHRFVGDYEGVAIFKVPGELPKALLRAAAMLPEKSPIDLEVAAIDTNMQALRLYSNTAAGEFDDLMQIEASGHPELTVRADVGLIKRALPGRTALSITRDSVVLSGPPGFFHFISTRR